jgi:tetratricopeptide (TPR) repeat protein
MARMPRRVAARRPYPTPGRVPWLCTAGPAFAAVGQTIARPSRGDMTFHPPRSQGGTGLAGASQALAEQLLTAALTAHRAGTLDELLQRRPALTRRIARRWLAPVLGTAGDTLDADHALPQALALWLGWAVSRLRPDREPGFDGIEPEAWIDKTSWRPVLALACHFGFAPVPDFPRRYRRTPGEPAAETLCGLWAVGTSTFYRYLDKGRRLLLVEAVPPAGERALALRRAVQAQLAPRLGLADEAAAVAWHQRQAARAARAGDPPSALWHLLRAGDWSGGIDALDRWRDALARDGQTDALVDELALAPLAPAQRVRLHLAQAGLARLRDATDTERECLEAALRAAGAGADADRLMVGVASGALGKFYERRDPDRALSCYQDSADALWQASLAADAGDAGDADVREEYVTTLVKLAWLYSLRNDPRSKATLEQADRLRGQHVLRDETLAMLEQTWGEYWRRQRDVPRALEHKLRALNLYERLGHRQQVLKTYSNLSLIYSHAKDYERAIHYAQRVLAAAQDGAVEPEIVCSTELNLGTVYFWQGRYGDAIAAYEHALEHSAHAGIQLNVRWAHYNLAEAYYFRFKASGAPDDERQGDVHAAAALAAWPHSDPENLEAVRKLKVDVLGPPEELARDRMLPAELAAHFVEMAEVERQRAVLAVPMPAEQHVRAHLAIANAYLGIAAKEREAARSLIDKHDLGDRFGPEFDRLRATFDRELTREQRLATHWQHTIGDLLSDERRNAVLQHLLHEGSISKSSYARLCAVGPATASKHLGILADRGLLEQTGRGPVTRYLLPAA